MSAHQEREAFEAHTGYDWDDPYPLAAQARVLWSAAWGAAMAPAGEPANWRTVAVEALAWMEGAWSTIESQFGTDSISLDERIAMGEEQEIAAMRRIVSAPPSPAPDRAEVLRLADEMALRSYEEAQCACYTEEEAKSRNSQSSARAALVRLLGGE